MLIALCGCGTPLSFDAWFAHAFGDSASSADEPMSVDERATLQAIVAELERLGLVTPSP